MQYLTKRELEIIAAQIAADSKKDLDLDTVNSVTDEDYIAIVQDPVGSSGKNKKITVETLHEHILSPATEDDRGAVKVGHGIDVEDDGTISISTELKDYEQDTTHRLVTDSQITTWNEKQNALTFDSVPTDGSNNPVISDGIFESDKLIQNDLNVVKSKVPTAASSSNQLADKAWVNSSISTATADFRGTYNVVSDLHLSITSPESAVASALKSTITTVNKNDYSFVQIPTSDATPTEIARIDRYKYIDAENPTRWAFEYSLNNSSFTSAQWAAINSGITSTITDEILNVLDAEASRVLAEQGRVTAENGRVEAENGRVAAENTRNARYEAAEGTNAGSTAGDGSRWGSYKSAEAARDAISNQDHTRANTDHNTAASDHTTAGTDHTTATSDHTTAVADHVQAGQDHAQYLIDHESIAEKADRDTDAIAGNVAMFDGVGNPIDSGIPSDKVTQYDGYYPLMGVGVAKNLEGRNDVTDSFMERTTGGNAEVANGAAQLTEVAGKSREWNQLVQNGNFANTSNWSAPYGTLSASGNVGTYTVSSVNTSARLEQNVNTIANHKYIFMATVKPSVATTVNFKTDANIVFVNATIDATTTRVKNITTTTTAGTKLRLFLNQGMATMGEGDTIQFSNIVLIDLTLLCIDNLTTVEEVEAWLAENIGLKPYYPFNAGTVLNAKMQGIESLGFNLLDPATGKARIVGAYSDVYGNYYGIVGTHGTLTFTSDLGETSEITPDSDGKFLLEEPGWLDVSTPGADCAVFLWWDGTQTDYQPYERNTGDLDVTHIYGKLNGAGDLVQVWPTGMPGLGELRDKVCIENGTVVAKRAFKEVDMGDLPFNTTVLITNGFSAALQGSPRYTDYSDRKKGIISSKYPVAANAAVSNNMTDKSILRYDGNLFVRDSSYSDAATFKTAVTGQKLYYELATEQLYTDLVYQGSSLFTDGTPVELPVNYRVNNWGIERMIPQNDSDVITTFPELTCRYSIDAVEQLNTHTDEIADLYEGQEELDAKKPNKSGSYPDMAVGSAKAIEGNDTKVEDFTFTPIQCADGLAQIKDVRGKSLVLNQLVQNGNFASDSKWSIVNGTGSISDGVATLTASETNKNQIQQTTGNYFINGHRYYASAIINSGDANVKRLNAGGVVLAQTSGTGKQEIAEIISWSVNSGSYKVGVRDLATEDFQQYTVEKIVVIDLTLMFGAGNEPATVEEFEKMFPLPYYAYNAGSLLNNNTEEVESVGFNQWDEEWESGKLNSLGQNSADSNYIRSKNYIPVFSGQNYYFKKGNSPTTVFECWYDAGKNFIKSVTTSWSYGGAKAVPDGAYFLRFYFATTTYNHDICINLSDPSRNGTYEPYKKDTVELNLPTLTGKLNGEGESVIVAPDGAKSAGSVYDEFVVENGYITKFFKKITNVISLGDFTWERSGDTDVWWTSLNSAKVNTATNKDYIVTKYNIPQVPGWQNMSDGDIGVSTAQIRIYDSSFHSMTAEQVKTALTPVQIIYVLAEPLTYILDTPIPATFQAYNGGTLKQLPENTSTPTTAPMVMENVYAIDVLSVVQSLPKNYISAESLQNLLAAIQSAGIIAGYTMTYNDDTQKYQFVITPPSQE